MNDRVIWYTILGMAVITFITRFPMLVFSSRAEFPRWVERGLKMVPVGVFTSLTIPQIIFHHNDHHWNPDYTIAGLCALLIGMWRKQVFLSLIVGVLMIAIWRMVFS